MIIEGESHPAIYSDEELRADCAKAADAAGAGERERCARLAQECGARYGARWLCDVIRDGTA
jgi:hypothetical protein